MEEFLTKYRQRGYFLRILIAIDQLLNTLLGGSPDETLSSRAYRKQHTNKFWYVFRVIVDGIFFWQGEHCYKAYLIEKVFGHKDQNVFRSTCDEDES